MDRLRDLGFFSLVEAEGTEAVDCICLKGSFRDGGAFPASETERKPLQNTAWKFRLEVKTTKSPSKGILFV